VRPLDTFPPSLRKSQEVFEVLLATGNPNKQLIAELMKHGVEVELCGATATAHNWGNEDLLPGVQGQHECDGKNVTARSRGVRTKSLNGIEHSSRSKERDKDGSLGA
jgi:hypothetical protein